MKIKFYINVKYKIININLENSWKNTVSNIKVFCRFGTHLQTEYWNSCVLLLFCCLEQYSTMQKQKRKKRMQTFVCILLFSSKFCQIYIFLILIEVLFDSICEIQLQTLQLRYCSILKYRMPSLFILSLHVDFKTLFSQQ